MGLNLSEATANANPVLMLCYQHLDRLVVAQQGEEEWVAGGTRSGSRGSKDCAGGQDEKSRRAQFGENLGLDDINANNRREEENTQEQPKGSDRDSNNSGIE
ncbi:MAG: hypothetical protein MRQ13_02380 [Candidatus Midichloria sp.]|nr:hypothetical protein [Candidatus Midichloria sp.]